MLGKLDPSRDRDSMLFLLADAHTNITLSHPYISLYKLHLATSSQNNKQSRPATDTSHLVLLSLVGSYV